MKTKKTIRIGEEIRAIINSLYYAAPEMMPYWYGRLKDCADILITNDNTRTNRSSGIEHKLSKDD